jgi:hypothetical protein
VVRIAAFSYWANTYYGGAVPALGGALVLGALPRIKRSLRMQDTALMGLGLAILVNSRPYESFFACLPIAGSLAVWMLGRKAPSFPTLFRGVILPLGLLMTITAAAMGYYFWRVTGNPFRVPYRVNIEAYHLLYFPWETPKPSAVYHHAVMRDFYTGDPVVGAFERARYHALPVFALRPLPYWTFFFGPLLTLPLAAWVTIAPWRSSLRRSLGRKTGFLLLVCGVAAAGMALPIYLGQPHYAGALTCAFYALLMQALRYARHWKWDGQPSGVFLVRAVPLICLVLLAVRVVLPAQRPIHSAGLLYTWASPSYQNLDRAQAQAKIASAPGSQLAIVRYKPDHDAIFNEWVYNEADIDHSKVIWARDMGDAQNEELLQYFHDRHAWLVEPDETPPRLSSYRGIER